MHPALMVGLGGAVGSVLRFWLGGLMQHRFEATGFPAGTLAVNLLGCFAIGILAGAVETRHAFSPDLRLLLGAGLLGGFTTFSAFGNETVTLLRTGQAGLAAVNVVTNVVLGVGLAAAGRLASGALLR
jgi:CrcB protein